MIDENWLIKTNVGDVKPYEKALMFYDREEDVSGHTSAVGPNTKQVDLFGTNKYIKLITNFIIKNVDDPNINHSALMTPRNTHTWTVEGHKHSYHELHRHSQSGKEHIRYNNNLCTVLYLNVPKVGGEFYFILEKNTGIETYVIKPKVGDLLLFPWSVYHGVYPQGSGLRKSVSLDFDLSER